MDEEIAETRRTIMDEVSGAEIPLDDPISTSALEYLRDLREAMRLISAISDAVLARETDAIRRELESLRGAA